MSVRFVDQPRPPATYGLALMDEVIADAADATGVTAAQILGGSHVADLPAIRSAVVWVARGVLGWSWPRIGQAMDRHHTTMIHAFRQAEARREGDHDFRRLTDRLAERARERTGR